MLVAFDFGAHRVKLITPKGEVKWDSPVPDGTSGSGYGVVSKDRPWLAVAFGEGVIAVYDVNTGALLASDTIGAHQVAWTPAKADQAPRLIVDGLPMRAFELADPAQAKH
jgi:hypothetical protein